MIRRARRGDREVVGRMWSALMTVQADLDDRFAASDDALRRFENDFPQWLQSESRRVFVADEGDGPCGFATAERWGPPPIYRDRPAVYVQELFVEERCRRRGHGRALVDAVREWSRYAGALELRAALVAGSEGADAFWTAVGGTEITRTFAMPLGEAPADAPSSRRDLGFRF